MIESCIHILAQVAVPEASAKAISYYHSGNILWIFQWAWTLGLPLLFLITGHEMGHYVLHHAWWWLACFSFFAFAILYLTCKAANFLLPRYQKQLGFQHLYNIASLPLLLFLVNFFILLSTPIFNYGSRYTEREADRFGIEITRNNE